MARLALLALSLALAQAHNDDASLVQTTFDSYSDSDADTYLLLRRSTVGGPLTLFTELVTKAFQKSKVNISEAEAENLKQKEELCKREPIMCEKPLSCHKNWPNVKEVLRWGKHGLATPDGHANYGVWCIMGHEFADNLLQKCVVEHDLVASADIVYGRKAVEGYHEIDGSYCFSEGHCTDSSLDTNSTVEDAEKECDRRYGNEWKTMHAFQKKYWHDAYDVVMGGMVGGPFGGGFSSKKGLTRPSLRKNVGMLACAMGNYHCDATYCKRHFCGKAEMQRKYGKYVPNPTAEMRKKYEELTRKRK